jgi:phospholipid/cholesterol/gamma-HCH transport system ATP-binding protein
VVEARGLSIAGGPGIGLRGLNFAVLRARIAAIMGDGGAGKGALLRALAGLERPADGEVFHSGQAVWAASEKERARGTTACGILLSGGALLSGMSLVENVMLPLRLGSALSEEDLVAVARSKLALVGLAGSERRYPGEVHEAGRVWAGLARATALDPDLVFLEDPTSRLDPLGAKRMRETIRRMRDDHGVTVVMVSNDVGTILAVADDVLFLDREEGTMIGWGSPESLRDASPHPRVRAFLAEGRP